jgi:hypothetical protein
MFPNEKLLNYGVAVAILFPLIGFLLWAGRSIVKSLLVHIDEFFKGVLEQQKEGTAAMKELARAFTGIRENCLACRVDSVSVLRDAEERLNQKFVEVTWQAHDKTFADIEKGFTTLGARFDTALTGAATSIRASNERLVQEAENRRLRDENEELSRPHDVTGATPRPVRG